MAYAINLEKVPVTISNGTSLSPAIKLGAETIYAIEMPAAWDAASLTFQASFDDTTYKELFDDTGAAITISVAANQIYVISNPAKLLAIRSLKIRSGTSGVPVNQTADRTINLMVIP